MRFGTRWVSEFLLRNPARLLWRSISLSTIAVLTMHAQGGDRSNIVGLGMARTSAVTSRGVDAIGINPANLATPGSPSFSLTALPFGVRLGTDFLNYGLYRQYLTGVSTDSGTVGYYLTDKDKEKILSGFSSGVGTINGDMGLKLVSASFYGSGLGGLGLGITERVGGNGVLSKDYLRFLFYGNSPGQTLDFADTKVRAWWLRDYSLSYAVSFENAFGLNLLTFGITGKYVTGFGYFDLEETNTSFTTSYQNVVTGHAQYLSHRAGTDFLSSGEGSSFALFPAPAGTGWGLDFGMHARVSSFLSFGASVTDIGSLHWTHNARERRANGDFTIDDVFSEAQQDSLENLVEGIDQKINGFETQLPTAAHIGLALQLGQPGFAESLPNALLEFDYNQGFNEMPGNSTKPRFSVGMELRLLSWLPLRSGVSVGGADQKSWAFGFGLHLGPFALDTATEDILSLLQPDQASRVSAGIGVQLKF
jgi:hypothetical protein